MEIWQSDEFWYVNDNGKEYKFSTQEEAIHFMISETSIEQELAQKIVGQLIPQLRSLYKEMVAMGVDWSSEEFQTKLQQAMQSQGYLAGFPVSDWLAWGAAFAFINEALNQPIEEIGGLTCRQVLTKRYVAG